MTHNIIANYAVLLLYLYVLFVLCFPYSDTMLKPGLATYIV